MPQDTGPQQPIATVDAVVFTLASDMVEVLLHRRPREPHQGLWALPGGWIHVGEDADAEAAIRRVLADKTGAGGFYLEQLRTYSGPQRDPRGWSMSVAHLALVPRPELTFSEDDNTRLFALGELPELAFDHARIIADADQRLRGKGAYSTLPASFLGEAFTLSEMQRAYEVVLDRSLDQSSFRRKVMGLDILDPVGRAEPSPDRKRPPQMFRLREGVRTFDRTLGQSLD